jgi:assimilatory nitrate reductase catalytic subunit
MHPGDLTALGVTEGGLVTLGNERDGLFTGRVRAEPGQRQGEVFVPIHWSHQFTGEGLASALISPVTDPVSGQPDSKNGLVTVTPLPVRWHARLLRHREASRGWQADYHTLVPQQHCYTWYLAGKQPQNWHRTITRWLGGAPDLVLEDSAAGTFRAARIRHGQLDGVLLVARDASHLPDTAWLASLFDGRQLSRQERRGLLSARSVETEDIGAVVCSCFGVGEKQIAAAIGAGARTVEALGEKLRCGTNCGSCLPELKASIEKQLVHASVD